MTPRQGRETERVLVLAPTGRDAALAADVLAAAGLEARPCADIEALCSGIRDGAGTAVVAEEALRPEGVTLLLDTIARQPPWSDFPVILLGESDGPLRREQRLTENANVTILERPFRMRTLLAAVRSALRARRRQYDAQRAIRDRDQFLAMLGHELRNPLSAILLSLQLLAPPPEAGAAKAHERQLAVVERQARRLSRLVDDLLDVSRITTGKVQLRTKPLDLREVLERSAETMAATARDAGLAFVVDLPAEPVPVEADPVRLEQVFTNLLANSVKFTPSGGRLELRAGVDGGQAYVTVRDSGVGIDPAGLQRIFELFAQLETTMDRSRGGLGIGLTVAKSLVELHGGSVTAHSEGPGKGAEFAVRLPLAGVLPEPEEAPQAMAANVRTRIVLVEDNEDIRASFRDLLVQAGHEVYEAEDGDAGLDLVVSRRPDVAFVDIGLPGMDGYELARRVRNRMGHAVRLVAVTGYGQPEDRLRARAAGFDEHLTKPVDPDVLHRVLQVKEPVLAAA